LLYKQSVKVIHSSSSVTVLQFKRHGFAVHPSRGIVSMSYKMQFIRHEIVDLYQIFSFFVDNFSNFGWHSGLLAVHPSQNRDA
jgi:hypothetical protein